MFKLFKSKETVEPLDISNDEIVAMADGQLIDIASVPDEMFSTKMMGETTAFDFGNDTVTICAPANGTLSVLFPTGHAFGIQTNNGLELLVHIGINTVEANGDGFKVLNVKQGDTVKAGQPIIEANFKQLSKKYNTNTMLIITTNKEEPILFTESKPVKRGQSVIQ